MNGVGLYHFKKVFSDPNFYRVLGNTIKISILTLVTSFPVTICFALLVNEILNMKFKRVVQTITYMPHFLSGLLSGRLYIRCFLPPAVL